MKRVITKYFIDFENFRNTTSSSFTWTICVSLKISSANISYSTILLFLIHSFPCGPPCLGMLCLLKKKKTKTSYTFYCLPQWSIRLKLTRLISALLNKFPNSWNYTKMGALQFIQTWTTFTTGVIITGVLLLYTYASSTKPAYRSFINRNFWKFLIYKFLLFYDLLRII